MYFYDKDYIMHLIHEIAQMLAYLYFRKKETALPFVMGEEAQKDNDYLRRMIDNGDINDAEDRLFDLTENAAWDEEQKAAVIISFYECLNGKKDDFLHGNGFSREEIVEGLEDALKLIGKEIPEYLRIAHD